MPNSDAPNLSCSSREFLALRLPTLDIKRPVRTRSSTSAYANFLDCLPTKLAFYMINRGRCRFLTDIKRMGSPLILIFIPEANVRLNLVTIRESIFPW